jgi:hypothetical protein
VSALVKLLKDRGIGFSIPPLHKKSNFVVLEAFDECRQHFLDGVMLANGFVSWPTASFDVCRLAEVVEREANSRS